MTLLILLSSQAASDPVFTFNQTIPDFTQAAELDVIVDTTAAQTIPNITLSASGSVIAPTNFPVVEASTTQNFAGAFPLSQSVSFDSTGCDAIVVYLSTTGNYTFLPTVTYNGKNGVHIARQTHGAGNGTIWAWYITGFTPGTANVVLSRNDYVDQGVVTVVGLSNTAASPVGAFVTGTGTTSATASLTTTKADSLILSVGHNHFTSGGILNLSSSPSGITQILDNNTNGNHRVKGGSQEVATSGTLVEQTFTGPFNGINFIAVEILGATTDVPWKPTNLPDLVVWLNVRDGDSDITYGTGSDVATWGSHSTTTIDATTVDSGQRPAYSATAIAGNKPGVVFTLDVDTLEMNILGTVSGAGPLNNAYSFGGVFEMLSGGSWRGIVGTAPRYVGANDRSALILGRADSSNQLHMGGIGRAASSSTHVWSGSGTPQIVTATGNGFGGTTTMGSQTFHKNGSTGSLSGTGAWNSTGGNTITGFYDPQYYGLAFGYPGWDTGGGFSVGEWVFCDATLTTDDRQKLEGYFAHNWGMTDDLPSDHPYKVSLPTATPSGGGGVTGTFAQTIDNITQTTEVDVRVTGSAAQTLDNVTQTTEVDVRVTASAAQSISNVTQAADLDVRVTGTLASTISNITQTTEVDIRVTATAAQTISNFILAANLDHVLWTPEELVVQPLGWYDAADTATLTLSGSDVTVWANKGTASDGNLDTTNSSKWPEYGASSFNSSYPGITFSSSNSETIFHEDGTMNPWGGAHAVFVVMEDIYSPATGWRTYWASRSSNDPSNNTYGLLGENGTRKLHYTRIGNSGESSSAVFTAGAGQHAITCAAGVVTTADGLLYIDGVADTNNPLSATGWSSPGFVGFQLGARDNGGPLEFSDMRVAEIVVLNYVPTLDDRQKIEGYLAHKWGIDGRLDAGHPYKTNAPESGGGLGTIIGTFAQTITNITQSTEVDVRVTGNATQTIANITQSADLDVRVTSTFSNTISNITQAATGAVRVTATAAQTIDNITQAASSAVRVTATGINGFNNFTLAATGAIAAGFNGVFNNTIDNITQTTEVDVRVNGTAAQTLANITQAADLDVRVTSTFNNTIANITQAVTAGPRVTGTFNKNIGDIAFVSTGVVRVTATGITGFGNITSTASGVIRVTGTGINGFNNVTQTTEVDIRVNASFDQTIANITQASTLRPIATLTFSNTIAPITLASDGDVRVTINYAQTIDNIALLASSIELRQFTFTQTIAPITQVASGIVRVTGTGINGFNNVTQSTEVDIRVAGTAAQAIPTFGFTGDLDVRVTSTFNNSIGSITLTATGGPRVTATAAQSIPTFTFANEVDVRVTSQAAQTIANVTQSVEVDVRVVGTFNNTITNVTQNSSSRIIVGSDLNQPIGDFNISTLGRIRVNATLAKTIDAITLESRLRTKKKRRVRMLIISH